MQLITDASRGDWFVERAGVWATVGGVASTGFDAYARLLHPLSAHREELSVTDDPESAREVEHARWRWAEVARRNHRVMHPLVQWMRLTDGDQTRSWADGWRVDQCDQGWFDPTDLAVLTTHLRSGTTTPEDLTLGAWEGTGRWLALARRSVMHWPGRDTALFRTSLTELGDPSWAQRPTRGWETTHLDQEAPYASVIWPADHAWVVASEEDWDSTIVAGSRTLVDAVLADQRFESFEVTEDSDLSWDGDTLNARRRP